MKNNDHNRVGEFFQPPASDRLTLSMFIDNDLPDAGSSGEVDRRAHSPNGVVSAIPDDMQGHNVPFFSGYRETEHTDTNSQIALDFCGYEYCRPGHSFGPIARAIPIIHVVLDGKGYLRIGETIYEITGNQIFLLPAGVETFYWADEETPWHYCWIGFHGTSAGGIARRIGLSKEHPVVSIDNAVFIENLIKNTMKYFELNVHDQLMRTGLLCTILAHLIQETRAGGDQVNELDTEMPYDEYAIRYLQMHFRDKVRINELADKIGISRSYLVKLVKAKINMSPQEYLIKIRMEHAVHYLNHTNDTIREVAASCGYDDSLAFSRAFHQYYGMSPSDFRAKIEEGGLTEEMMKRQII